MNISILIVTNDFENFKKSFHNEKTIIQKHYYLSAGKEIEIRFYLTEHID